MVEVVSLQCMLVLSMQMNEAKVECVRIYIGLFSLPRLSLSVLLRRR